VFILLHSISLRLSIFKVSEFQFYSYL